MVSDTICNTYDDLLAVALRAEQLGFGAFFRSDHYLNMGADSGLPGPTDAWITLAGLARETSDPARNARHRRQFCVLSHRPRTYPGRQHPPVEPADQNRRFSCNIIGAAIKIKFCGSHYARNCRVSCHRIGAITSTAGTDGSGGFMDLVAENVAGYLA